MDNHTEFMDVVAAFNRVLRERNSQGFLASMGDKEHGPLSSSAHPLPAPLCTPPSSSRHHLTPSGPPHHAGPLSAASVQSDDGIS
eukprot:scaffold2730_cov18-Tisochrysis_lutea.AAC.1